MLQNTSEPTIATRSTLSDLLRAPGGAYAALHLIRREVTWVMLRECPHLVPREDPWYWGQFSTEDTQLLPVVPQTHASTYTTERRRDVRFRTGRVVVA